KDKTVLADEQVIDGRCERCESVVERRWLEQWFLKITAYAQQLLDGLEQLDWSERVKAAQRNWIGRSDSGECNLELRGTPERAVQAYRRVPEAIFGTTFLALVPQLPLIERITGPARKAAVVAYQQAARVPRMGASRAATGAFTGAYAL